MLQEHIIFSSPRVQQVIVLGGTLNSNTTPTPTTLTFLGETPYGSNTIFTLTQSPSVASFTMLFVNGVCLTYSLDYSLSANLIVFKSAPPAGSIIRCHYITSGTGALGETLAGSVNGANTVFTISQTPDPAAFVLPFLNGLNQAYTTDIALDGTTLTFASAPPVGSIVRGHYITTAQNIRVETPTGTVDGDNDTFALTSAPSPANFLMVFLNGMYVAAGGVDYTLSGTDVVFNSPPPVGTVIRTAYAY